MKTYKFFDPFDHSSFEEALKAGKVTTANVEDTVTMQDITAIAEAVSEATHGQASCGIREVSYEVDEKALDLSMYNGDNYLSHEDASKDGATYDALGLFNGEESTIGDLASIEDTFNNCMGSSMILCVKNIDGEYIELSQAYEHHLNSVDGVL